MCAHKEVHIILTIPCKLRYHQTQVVKSIESKMYRSHPCILY